MPDLLARVAPAQRQDEDKAARPMREIRFVVIHSPGPAWKPDVPLFEQQGVHEHVAHFRTLLDSGKLMLGGPFVDEMAGGMMIPEATVSEDEMRRFASEDPAVQSGLLTFEIRPWVIGMRK